MPRPATRARSRGKKPDSHKGEPGWSCQSDKGFFPQTDLAGEDVPSVARRTFDVHLVTDNSARAIRDEQQFLIAVGEGVVGTRSTRAADREAQDLGACGIDTHNT